MWKGSHLETGLVIALATFINKCNDNDQLVRIDRNNDHSSPDAPMLFVLFFGELCSNVFKFHSISTTSSQLQMQLYLVIIVWRCLWKRIFESIFSRSTISATTRWSDATFSYVIGMHTLLNPNSSNRLLSVIQFHEEEQVSQLHSYIVPVVIEAEDQQTLRTPSALLREIECL